MNAALYLRLLARESRGSLKRFAFFVACLAVGVAAVVSVAGLSAALSEGANLVTHKLQAIFAPASANPKMAPERKRVQIELEVKKMTMAIRAAIFSAMRMKKKS